MKYRKPQLILLLAGLVFVYFFSTSVSVRYYLSTETVVGRWIMPSKIAIKKIYNIVHLPYWFLPSELPVYHLNISQTQLEELQKSLPFDPKTLSYGFFSDEDQKYVNASFLSPDGDYSSDIKVRYKGAGSDHWRDEQKSLRLKFPSENLFEGQKSLVLNVPYDRSYFGEPMNMYRAKKFELIATDFEFVRLFVNTRDLGVYLAYEPWSKERLAKLKKIDTNNVFSSPNVYTWPEDKKIANKLFNEGDPIFTEANLPDWKSYTAEDGVGSFEELKVLTNLVENASDKEFEEKIGTILDLEKFYRWQVVSTLVGSAHQGDIANTVLLFRQEDGKFENIPWDVEVWEVIPDFYNGAPSLVKRILSNQRFFDEYNKLLKEYVSNDDNLKDDLAYYDGLYKKYKAEFYNNQAKLHNDYEFDSEVKRFRELIVANFNNAKQLAELESFPGSIAKSNNKNLEFDGSFKYFNDIFLGIDSFVSRNPQFYKIDNGTIVLSQGNHVFSRNVVIPKGLKLVIEPGAKLFFGPGVSMISYSPVSAVGNATSPIIITGLDSSNPWGSFGVVNTGNKKNYFNFVYVSGGSAFHGSTAEKINGIPFISQFSLRNTDSEIYNSIFENGYSDDAFHAISGSVIVKNSIFRNTFSDAMDLDNVKNSKIIGNRFYNLSIDGVGDDGDGLDISGTEGLEISDNQINNFGDKCISIGERAEAVIKNNILSNCNYGIAVKDDSTAQIDNNIVVGNRIGGLTLYRKKQDYIRGGNAQVTNSIFWGNQKEILVDETAYYPTKSGEWKNVIKAGISSISVNESTVKGGMEGINIRTSRPDFESILPASVYRAIKSLLN